MTKQNAGVQWTSDMAFRASVNGFDFMIDADEKVGGHNLGPRPKPLLLVALAGCTAMDVISILRKMRIEPSYFNIEAEGDITEEHPKHFTRIHLVYEFRGDNLPLEQLQKAVSLSQEKYCGVSETLKKALEITSEIRILKD
jgi:putative redox protein